MQSHFLELPIYGVIQQMFSNEQNVPIYMYKKADHSLETGDIIKDIEILEDVMKRTKKYL